MISHSRRRRIFLSVISFGGLIPLSGCSPISLINKFTPEDTYKVTEGIVYGDLERRKLDVYMPANLTGGTQAHAPVVVFFYGGNWNSGERGEYLFVGEALAEKGFITVIADYRLYPDVRYPDFLDDCARAVQWTFAHIGEFGGDPKNVFLMGHSAGAYNAAMLALNSKYLQQASTSAAAIRGFIGLAGPYDFLPIQDKVVREVFGYPDTPRSTQPIEYVSAAAPPTLLLVANDDDLVNPGNSARLAARLRSQGVPVKHIIYPGLGHRLLIGAMAKLFRRLAPVVDDVAAFIRDTAAQPLPAAVENKRS